MAFPYLARFLSSHGFRRTVPAITDAFTMTGSNQNGSVHTIPQQGDITGFFVNISLESTGTLSTPKTADVAVAGINIYDKQGNAITTGVIGTDLSKLQYWVSGNKTTPSTVSSSSVTSDNYVLPIQVAAIDQAASIQYIAAAYSALASSGATGGTLTVTTVPYYNYGGAAQTQWPAKTSYLSHQALSIVSGTNTFGPNLNKGRVLYNLTATMTTESNLTSVTVEPTGGSALEQLTFYDFIAFDQVTYPTSGHQTGYMDMNITPFVVTDQTQFNLIGAGSDTLQLYQWQYKV